MKKNKQKEIVKEEKKLAKKEFTAQVITALRSVLINFVGDHKKIEKLIEKRAKQLAKKLSKEITIKPIKSVVAEEKSTEKIVARPKATTKKEKMPA